LKKQRLIELQNKAEEGNSELKDSIEILAEFFVSQSQHNKELKNEILELNSKITSLNRKIDQILKFTTTEPLAQILIENLEEFEKNQIEDDDDE
jgi:hypothetical protein